MTRDEQRRAIGAALNAAGLVPEGDLLDLLVDEVAHGRDEAIGVVLAAYPGLRYGEAARLVDLAREALG